MHRCRRSPDATALAIRHGEGLEHALLVDFAPKPVSVDVNPERTAIIVLANVELVDLRAWLLGVRLLAVNALEPIAEVLAVQAACAGRLSRRQPEARQRDVR